MIVDFQNLHQLKASVNKQLYVYTSKIVQVSIEVCKDIQNNSLCNADVELALPKVNSQTNQQTKWWLNWM